MFPHVRLACLFARLTWPMSSFGAFRVLFEGKLQKWKNCIKTTFLNREITAK